MPGRRIMAGMALVLGLVVLPAGAGSQVLLGAQLAWGSDPDDIGLGVRAEVPLSGFAPGLAGLGSVDFFFPEGWLANQIDLNAGAVLRLSLPGLAAYVGAGINLQRISATAVSDRESGTHAGVALWGGVHFRAGWATPFAELRSEIGGITQTVLSAGVLFSLDR